MFRNQQRYLGFAPEDGQEVMIRGQVSVFEPRGEYQVIIDYMEPVGEGALRLAFEKLKASLAAGRSCSTKRARSPCRLCRSGVALVTSPTGGGGS